jgi:LuxR family maltose regulon positive regulatory protein
VGQHDAAIHILTELSSTAEQQGRYGSLIENLLLMAIALHQQGSVSRAIETFERMLTLCDPAEYAMLFIREGALVIPLLQQAGTRGIASRYIGQLLRAVPEFTKNTVQPLNDPLSERELEILRLVAVGLSNEAIADQLIIAPSTVKWHVRNICGKLHSENRTQAVARARELRMLS